MSQIEAVRAVKGVSPTQSNPHHSDAMLVQSRGRIFPQSPSLSGSASSVGAASAAGAAPAPQPTLKARNLPVGNVKRGANYRSRGSPLGSPLGTILEFSSVEKNKDIEVDI